MPHKEIESYIQSRFAASAVRLRPFAHLVIEDVLPAELHAEMTATLPSGWRWFRASLSCKAGQQPIFAIRPNDQTHAGLSRYAKLWQERYQRHIDLVDRCTLEKMRPMIDAYLERLQSAGFLRRRPEIIGGQSVFCQRGREWFIEPHVHDVTQLIQSMIYFPQPRSTVEQGTVLYKGGKELQKKDLFRTHVFEPRYVEDQTLIPYKPNTLIAFLNTPASIHSSSIIKGPPRRYIFTGMAMDRSAFNPEASGSIHSSHFQLAETVGRL